MHSHFAPNDFELLNFLTVILPPYVIQVSVCCFVANHESSGVAPREPGKAGSLTLFSIFPVLGTNCLTNGLWHSCQMSFRSLFLCELSNHVCYLFYREGFTHKIIHILRKRDYLTLFLFAHWHR